MKTETIVASQLIGYQKWLRMRNYTLIRATPFTSIDNVECYRIMYVESK